MVTITKANLTCPECVHEQVADMPGDACQFFYECVNCDTVLKTLDGDCCVFCSFSDQKCPVLQVAA